MSPSPSRRTVLQTIGAGTVLAATGGTLTACSSSGGSSTGGVGNAGTELTPWPAYVPFDGPAPDLAPNGDGVQAGYLTYPQNLKQSVAEKPGDGTKVIAWVITYGPPAKPLATNKLWQAVNKALGIDLDLVAVPSSEYQTKLATMTASGEMPDMLLIGGGKALPNEAHYVAAKCADLSEHLSGDAIKKYPNLANIPTYAWEGMGRIKGRVFGVPIERGRPSQGLYVNQEKFKEAGIWVPETGALDTELLTKGLRQLTGRGRWGLGASQAGAFGFNVHMPNHGAPKEWFVNDGAFVNSIETDEWLAGLEQMTKWHEAGLFRADALTVDPSAATLEFQNGTTASMAEGLGGFRDRCAAVKDGFTVDIARSYKPANGKRAYWLGNGFFGYTVLRKAPKDRIELMLRVLDYLSAPFGSEEWELVNYGVEGTHFTRGSDGGPEPTELAVEGENSTTLPLKYLAAGPQVIYNPGMPEATKRFHAYQQAELPGGTLNPANGLRSNTWSTKGATLQQLQGDAIAAIVTGRRPLSDWAAVIKEWKAKGGDQAAEEFAKEYQATKG
ncbi:extracellular solute-binding protein [Streptomyces sp. NPDC007861]|uniref:extracellular solute-binding protein n=1 Tax=Streptomyces sp. NPDC007861 TaxID=3154893 RepID=UPI0033C3B295